MKLINKLLPIVTIGSVASIVAPIATSCGSLSRSFNGYKIYIPKSDRAVPDKQIEKVGYSSEQATKLYYKDLAENTKIFAEDIFAQFSYEMYAIAHAVTTEVFMPKVNARLSYSNVSTTLDETTYGTPVFNLSYELKAKINIEAFRNTTSRTPVIFKLNKIEMKVENMPYLLYSPGSEINEWFVIPVMFYMMNDIAWPKGAKFQAKLDGYFIRSGEIMSFDNESIDINDQTANDTSVRHLSISEMLVEYFGAVTGSYHMGDIYSENRD